MENDCDDSGIRQVWGEKPGCGQKIQIKALTLSFTSVTLGKSFSTWEFSHL